jgi:isoamylase
VHAGGMLSVAAKSLVVLRAHSAPEEEPDHSVAASLAALTQTATAETAALTAPAIPEPAKTKQPIAKPEGTPGVQKPNEKPAGKAAGKQGGTSKAGKPAGEGA